MGVPALNLRLVSPVAVEPPIAIDERERVAELRSLGVLDTPAEERFDRVTRIACRLFGVTTAAVALLDAERAFLKSCQGVEVREVDRSDTMCAHAIVEEDTFVVEDATWDERFCNNPFVAAGVRFYAGQPLRGPTGKVLGTLCIVDNAPRTFSVEDRESLRDLARIVEQELAISRFGETQRMLVRERDEARRTALLDGLTQAWNRRAMDELLEREVARARREGTSVAVAMVDIDHFKSVNDLHGHPMGDAVLRAVADRLRGAVRAHDTVGRYGGEEFMVVLTSAGPAEARAASERIRAEIARLPLHGLSITASIGVASFGGSSQDPFLPSDIVEAADAALYRAKRTGRNRVTLA